MRQKRFKSEDFQRLVKVLLVDVEKPRVSFEKLAKKETLRV